MSAYSYLQEGSSALDSLAVLKQQRMREGREIIDLSMINPDIPPPRVLMDRLVEATLKVHNHRYAVSRGVRRAREGFSTLYSRRFGVEIDPETEACLTFGTKDAINLLFSLFGERISPLGKKVTDDRPAKLLLPAPTYPGFLFAAAHAHLDFDYYRADGTEDETLQSIAHGVQKAKPTAIVLNYPNNPTGLTVSARFYERLGALLADTDIWLINDFVYGEMSDDTVSMLREPSLRQRAVETYSLSKSYSVPGWRVGAVLGAEALVRGVAVRKSVVDYGVFLPLQLAAGIVLSSGEQVTRNVVQEYSKRASVLTETLRHGGFEIVNGVVGASLWARLPERYRAGGSVAFAERALDLGIAVTPGCAFADSQGALYKEFDEFIRFALVAKEERLRSVARLYSEDY